MPQRRIDLLELGESDYAELKELAERESRRMKDLGALLIRFGLFQLRSRSVESVSAMTNALFEDEKCQELKPPAPSNG